MEGNELEIIHEALMSISMVLRDTCKEHHGMTQLDDKIHEIWEIVGRRVELDRICNP